MSSGIEKKKKRRRVVKKHRNNHGGSAAVAPPSRLGWLGEGLTNDEQQLDNNNFNGSQSSSGGLDNNNNKHDNNFMNGSQSSSSERLLTPRPDDDNDIKMSAAGMSKSNGGGGAVDLTADDSDDSDDCNNINNNSWTCRKCTLVNSETVSVCDACNTRRESTRTSNKSCTNNEIDSDDELLGGYDGDEPQAGKKKHKRLKKGSDSSNTTSTRKKTDDTAVATKKDQKKKKKKSNSSSGNGKKYQSTLLSEHFSTQTINNNNSKVKKSKSTTYKQHSFKNNSLSISKSTTKSTNTEMWIDKHAPQTIKEVCVAPKKIEEVRQFLNSHVEYITYQRRRTSSNKRLQQQDNAIVNPWDIPTNPIQPQTKLQILVGSPGIGKSTLLSVLAQELNIEVLRWNDIHVDYNMNSGGGGGRESGGYLPYQSQLSSFEEFLNSGSVGITSLDIGGDNTSSLKLSSSAEKKKRKGSGSGGKNSEEYAGSLILVEEIPNLYNDEAAQSFRNIMERHIQRTQTPTFFIYSDVQEGKHKPEDLERLIPPHILYSQLVQIIQIQPVTKAKMKKALQSIAKVERLGSLSTEFVEEMHLSSGGDLRHAIFALQFQSSTMMMTSRSRSRNRNSSEEGGSTVKKDAKLSTFHALGKLLYAKRKPATNQHHHHDFSDDDSNESAQGYLPSSQSTTWNQSKWNDERGPLEFVPEDVLSRVDMTLSSAMSFISFHSPDFFMDVTDLSRSFDLISDSATFMDYQFSSSQNSTDAPFPMQYASCIGGRAVADGNRHPAPPQFRQFTAPKVFSVMKKNRENEYKIDKLRKRLSLGSGRSGGGGSGTSQETGGGITSIHDNIGSAQQFVTDSLPYMRNVIPQDVNYALANLHSYANDASGHANNEPQAPEEKENAVLLEDDLVDDNDW